jgi:asparagine synthase (glutamine-hydrolysing)
VPFLTPALIRYARSLPEELLIGGDGSSKIVLRRAMRGIVPDEILDRRDKIGFLVPTAAWMHALRPWVRRLLHSPEAERITALRLDVLRARLDSNPEAMGAPDALLFWRCANLICWAKRFGVEFEPSSIRQ